MFQIRYPSILATAMLASTALVHAEDVFTVTTLSAQMRYDVSEINTSPGAQVKIIFDNTDDMPHNMVFCMPGTNVVELANKQLDDPAEALKREWVPNDPKVWFASPMLNPKEKQELTFKAPDKPGVYPFVCTFPGHAATMQGKLNVFSAGKGLKDLTFKMYLGDWNKLPNFARLESHREGPIEDNLVQIKLDDYKNQFGVVYEGKLPIDKAGEYTFAIAGDDGVRLAINGKKVVDHDGIHPSSDIREGKVKLEKGEHSFRLEYFQATGEAEVYVAYRGGNYATTPLSKWVHPAWKTGMLTKKVNKNVGIPLVVKDEPVVYRNFIAGAGNRGIAVGYPGGMSIAWSAERMTMAIAWRGAFMDAARHWNDRGGGHQPPLGYDAFRPIEENALPLAIRESADSAWPKLEKNERAPGYAWKGYRLDEKRFPTFFYTWNDVQVADRFDVEGDAVNGQGRLVRTLKLTGKIPANASFRAATGNTIEAIGSAFKVGAGKFNLGGVDYSNDFLVSVDGGKVVGDNHIEVPARPEIQVIYTWPNTHAAHAPQAHAHGH